MESPLPDYKVGDNVVVELPTRTIERLEYSFTFNPSLLTIPKRKQQVAEILKEAETYIWRIKEEMRCA